MINKKVIVVIVIFILGGFLIYSFANPLDGNEYDNGESYNQNDYTDDQNQTEQKDPIDGSDVENKENEDSQNSENSEGNHSEPVSGTTGTGSGNNNSTGTGSGNNSSTGTGSGSSKPSTGNNGTSSEEQPTYYTVTFNSDGGTFVASQQVKKGEKATKPSNPTKDGYVFAGWNFDFNIPITSNVTIKAKWTKNAEQPSQPSTGNSGDTSQSGGQTQPSTPTEPDTPSQPSAGDSGDTSQSGGQTQPSTPAEPDTPSQPSTPTEPDTPSQPEVDTRPSVTNDFEVANEKDKNIKVSVNGNHITYSGEMGEQPLLDGMYKTYIEIKIISPAAVTDEEFNQITFDDKSGSSEQEKRSAIYRDYATGKAYIKLIVPFIKANNDGLKLTTRDFDIYWGYGNTEHYTLTFNIVVN